jgi:ribonucleoside-diphosphate reductase alpha chain
MGGDALAADILVGKYLLKDSGGHLQEISPLDIHKRCAREFSRIESKYPNPVSYETILSSLDGFKRIVPQGSPLAGIGNTHQTVSLSNCFVIGSPLDSWGGICRKDEELAQVEKRRGGVGIDLSLLRPSLSAVRNSANFSDGVVCFASKYSHTSEGVSQNGRRGALMLSLDCRHPDILEFINCKRDTRKITGANISVKWHDDFLYAAQNNTEYTLRFPVDVAPEEAVIVKTVKALDIWNAFVDAAHSTGEPGCIFWDHMRSGSLSDCYDEDRWIITTNPCGEQPLPPYGSCVLMLLNLTGYIVDPYTSKAHLDEQLFISDVRLATRLIDDLVDLEIEKVKAIISKIESDPEPEDIKHAELNLWQSILHRHESDRRVGLGVTGLADMLAMSGHKYGSIEGIQYVDSILSLFNEHNMFEQTKLAAERGVFSGWSFDKEKDNTHIRALPANIVEAIRVNGRRNISTTTCSPAGTISLLTGTSSGVEPVFEVEYLRKSKMLAYDPDDKDIVTDGQGVKWKLYKVVHRGHAKWLEANPGADASLSPYYGNDAKNLSWRNRVIMQSTIQKYINSSISSTINLPRTATQREVSDIYMLAWQQGCKGITVYRDGSRENVLGAEGVRLGDIQDCSAPKRPRELRCDIHTAIVSGEQMVFFVGLLNNRPYEIFGGTKSCVVELPRKYKSGWIVKNGKDARGLSTYDLYLGALEDTDDRLVFKNLSAIFPPNTSGHTRKLSAMLRHGIPIKYICEQLHKDSVDADMFCFDKAVARVLKKYIHDGERAGIRCDKCGSDAMLYKDGCAQCQSCGDSKCG